MTGRKSDETRARMSAAWTPERRAAQSARWTFERRAEHSAKVKRTIAAKSEESLRAWIKHSVDGQMLRFRRVFEERHGLPPGSFTAEDHAEYTKLRWKLNKTLPGAAAEAAKVIAAEIRARLSKVLTADTGSDKPTLTD